MNNDFSTNNSRNGFTMIEVQAVIGIFLLVISLLMPSVGRSREAARRTQCRNNLKQIALAVNNYENKFGIFPPAMTIARPTQIVGGCTKSSERTGGFSWRALILPDVEEQNIYNMLDFDGTAGVIDCAGKNGPPNARWTSALKSQINVFLCPSDPTLADIDEKWFGASYAAMISIRPDYRYIRAGVHPTFSSIKQIGVMHPQKPARQRDVANDGTSHTILCVEVDRSKNVIQQDAPGKSKHPRCGRWFNSRGCYADACRTPNDFGMPGKLKVDECSTDNAVVWDKFISPKTHGWGRSASSPHENGAHVAMTDGSVNYASNKVDLQMYKNTCTRAGGDRDTIF